MDTPETCPLCHGPNDCGIALGKTTCWCFEQTIPEAVLAAIPEDQRNRACVCEACARAAAAAEVTAPAEPAPR